jgi:hypothetical protein
MEAKGVNGGGKCGNIFYTACDFCYLQPPSGHSQPTDNFKVNSATYPGLSTLQASRIHPSQLVLIRLREHTITSTIWPVDPSAAPGKGNLEQISAATTYASSLFRSYESTQIPFGISAFASAASPHPKSAITVPFGSVWSCFVKTEIGLVGHDCT